MDEPKVPSHVEIEQKLREFLVLMEQREVGLSTYLEQRWKMAQELREMLGQVIGVQVPSVITVCKHGEKCPLCLYSARGPMIDIDLGPDL